MLRMGRSGKETAESNERVPALPLTGTMNSAPVSSAETPERAAHANPTATPTPPRAYSENESLARDLKDGAVGGFVGIHAELTGEANFKGMLRVDGHVSGSVNSEKGTLIISAGGQADAEIEVAVAKINGTVNGNIIAHERIELGRTARVKGNIQTPALVIEQGALFEGGCHMPSSHAAQPTQTRAHKPQNNEAVAASPGVAPPIVAGKTEATEMAHTSSRVAG